MGDLGWCRITEAVMKSHLWGLRYEAVDATPSPLDPITMQPAAEDLLS